MAADTTTTDEVPENALDERFQRYSSVETDDLTVIVFDEEADDAWIQSDNWIDAHLMA